MRMDVICSLYTEGELQHKKKLRDLSPNEPHVFVFKRLRPGKSVTRSRTATSADTATSVDTATSADTVTPAHF